MNNHNADLVRAFPEALQQDALRVISALPEPSWSTETFSVHVGGEAVSIPYRIYHDPMLIDSAQLSPLQVDLLDCLLTRHHNGFVREEHLARIV